MSLVLRNATLEAGGCAIVRGLSLEFSPGKLTALVGPNGSGKSTLLRLAVGLLPPTSGAVLLDGRPIAELRRRAVARRVTLVPQDTTCAFAFSVRDFVAMGRNPHLGRFQREAVHDRDTIVAAMRRADVLTIADRSVTELSGGEMQRVTIARSLATEADILLLDEPTASLDIAHALDVLGLCAMLARQGKTVGLALHDLNAAARYADHVVLMRSGEIFAQGPPAETLTPKSIREVFRVAAERVADVSDDAPYVFRQLDR